METPPLFQVKNCRVQRDGKNVLGPVSFHILPREHTAIMGANGAGKSLLLRLLIGEDARAVYEKEAPPEVLFKGRGDWSLRERRRHIGVVSQYAEHMTRNCPQLTVEEAILSGGSGTYGFFTKEEKDVALAAWSQRAHTLMDEMGLKGFERRELTTLSTGQLRRVMIARAMVYAPEVLFLDEPTAGLDILAQRQLMKAVSGLSKQTTIILITHDMGEIFPEITHLLLLKDGKIEAHGPKEMLLTADVFSRVFSHPLQIMPSGEGYYHWQLGEERNA